MGTTSVADPDSGSCAFLTPGYGIRIREEFFLRIPDLFEDGKDYDFASETIKSKKKVPVSLHSTFNVQKMLGAGMRKCSDLDPE
jgi:hypothetical protein